MGKYVLYFMLIFVSCRHDGMYSGASGISMWETGHSGVRRLMDGVLLQTS